jgi:chaperone BCS1
MDVWVNFTHATKWQAEGIFKCFFPYKPSVAIEPAVPQDASQKNLPGSKRKASTHAIPLLSEEEISELAKRFAAAIPEDELSVSYHNALLSAVTDASLCSSRLRVFKVIY